jgi:molecular chaperone DnaK
MTQEKAVGIDLGTTNSAVAWIDPSGRTAMVPNAEGELLTPSIVLFDDAEVTVGKEARSATTVDPDRVAEWVKRDMGSPVFHRPIRGEYLPPEVIQACILRKLKSDLVGALGPEAQVVITVPAYFDELRRKATQDAAEMAGLSVLDIVNEPTAAALSFGEMLGYLSPGGAPREEMTVLVYDLGGGTFDVTLLRLAAGDVRNIATDGDVMLGGHDWDLRLVDHVAERFEKTHGVDPREDPASRSRLLRAVIEAKHTLSARARATVRVDHAGRSSDIPVTREQFEQLTADLLERTLYTCRQLVAAAKMQWKDVSRVLLVGGSTRMPAVARRLREITGLAADHTVNPDEAVARGAALYAGYLLAKQGKGHPAVSFDVTNVNAHGLGVEGIDQQTLRKTNVMLIPRNTPLPATFSKTFSTKSHNQRSIVIQVLQGESSLPGDCTAIGRTVVHNLPEGLPKGRPVEVTFEYQTNGRLRVRAVVPGADREETLELERDTGLSHAGVVRWKQVFSADDFGALDAIVEEAASGPTAFRSRPSASTEPQPLDGDSHGLPEVIDPETDRPTTGYVPRWVMALVFYVTSAVAGLALGYLLLSWLRPDDFPLPF